ncbi:phosphate ABC transporter permease subunit PstC [Actinophytocola sp.]|uniref:phosphate ABC transporter permease subunit PstC n=1 Tax=Actinophytocola sp. TaxID=1872138 RepID=UPI002ED2D6EE
MAGSAVGARRVTSTSGGADRVFRGVLLGAGVLVLAIMLTIGWFLFQRGWPALREAGWSFLTEQSWEPDAHRFGIAAVLTGTVLIAVVAVLIAVPLAAGVALYISEYAPVRLRGALTNLVDLMAAVPSVVYGLWGFVLLQEELIPLARWMAANLGGIPVFAVDGAEPDNPLEDITVYKSSTFAAGVVVALMIMPIICSVMRESFVQSPAGEREGAYALGATRWGMIRTVVLPFGRGGMIGGTMLGLGRAMGETIAVFMIISPIFLVQPHILQSGTSSVSALIALRWGAASPFELAALMAAGLALFLLTLVINFAASAVIARTRSGQGSEG